MDNFLIIFIGVLPQVFAHAIAFLRLLFEVVKFIYELMTKEESRSSVKEEPR